MVDRPSIGERVTLLGNTGLKSADGRAGVVIGLYPDGIAFRVRLDGSGKEVVCDPVNVELENQHA